LKTQEQQTSGVDTASAGLEKSSTLRKLFLGSSRVNLPLALIAFVILLGSLSIFAHNNLNKEDTETVVVNGKEYRWEEVFDDFDVTTMEGKEGVLLSELVNDTGLEEPGSHEYKIIAADGYAKTVKWEDMENGIVLKSKEVFFPDLVKQYYVRDIVEIEVK